MMIDVPDNGTEDADDDRKQD